MSGRSRFLSAVGFGLGLLITAQAGAYCRTNSCDTSRGETCTRVDGCLQGGVPLYWANACTTFSVQRDGSPKNNIAASDFEEVIATAFSTWEKVDCGGGVHPKIAVNTLGEVDCDRVEYNQSSGNANIYLFRDTEWAGTGANALALTTVWYDWKTGKIFDADTEVNGTAGDITNTVPEAGADLPSIITHESGHFLGLDHSQSAGATMYAFYMPRRDNLRQLTQDDIDGICAIYPADRSIESNSCNPRHGFSSSCKAQQVSGGCSTQPGAPGSAGLLTAALGIGLARLLRRRRQA